MADLKISALTASTTPLAGTEVLPVVQSGVTKKVSVADLTAGRAVSTGALTVVGANATLDNAYSLVGKLVAGTAVGMMRRNSSDEVAIDEDGYGTKIGFGGRFGFASGGDFTVGVGNLVIGTSGKGIDFSATAGTGTSELLNDYEEGTHTATITPGTSGTVTLTDQTLTYVKVGALVTVTGYISVATAVAALGYFSISLPFAIASTGNSTRSAPVIVPDAAVSTNINNFVGIAIQGASAVRIYLGNATSLSAASAQQLLAGGGMHLSFTYRTA